MLAVTFTLICSALSDWIEISFPMLLVTLGQLLGHVAQNARHLRGLYSCRNDVTGGRDAGCYAWLYGIDVDNFEEAATRLLDGQLF